MRNTTPYNPYGWMDYVQSGGQAANTALKAGTGIFDALGLGAAGAGAKLASSVTPGINAVTGAADLVGGVQKIGKGSGASNVEGIGDVLSGAGLVSQAIPGVGTVVGLGLAGLGGLLKGVGGMLGADEAEKEQKKAERKAKGRQIGAQANADLMPAINADPFDPQNMQSLYQMFNQMEQ